MSKTLIHTTTKLQANPIIEFFNLEEISKNKVYSSEKILLIISGLNQEEICESLEYATKNFQIKKAIDISCASCCDASVKIGTIFCTNKLIFGLNFANITTVEKDLESDEHLDTLLVDYQASFFKDFCNNKINDFYILKVVSDYFDLYIDEEFKSELIKNSIDKWKNLI